MAIEGYNIAFRLSFDPMQAPKVIAGRTQDDLTIAARTRERLTKDDEGSAQVGVVGQDITFRASALVEVSSQLHITRDQLVGYSLKSGSQAEIPFRYVLEDSMLEGVCVITNLSESSNASDNATLTVDFRVVGEPTWTAPAEEEEEEAETSPTDEPVEDQQG